MATTRIEVHTTSEAWQRAREIFPTEYQKDELRSTNAGYPIYTTTDKNRGGASFCWISDLGDRLEVNLPNAETVNIWIVESAEQKEIKALKTRIAELEAELEWKPYEMPENVKQADYDKLIKDKSTRLLTDEEAKELLYDWYGFAKEKITILTSVERLEINRDGHRIRKVGEIVRRPAYNATDWNYIRFNCGQMTYELCNDNLTFYYH